MAVENQLQFREHMRNKCKSWDSNIEFTMPGKLTLYQDYKPTDGVAEYASAAGKQGGRKANEVRSR
jgi:hypothetical protein